MSKAPKCGSCNRVSRIARGTEIYPRHKQYAMKYYWKCDGCGGYVVCHPDSQVPLGTPAGPDLRKARTMTHQRLDAIWKNADRADCYDQDGMDQVRRKRIIQHARSRVYRYLGAKMGLKPAQTHVGMFNIVQCRDAWIVLKGLTYSDVRRWAKEAETPQRQDGAAA